MAKALYGHLVRNDARLVWENDRLRARVADLEVAVERLSLELAAASEVVTQDMPRLETFTEDRDEHRRPALA